MDMAMKLNGFGPAGFNIRKGYGIKGRVHRGSISESDPPKLFDRFNKSDDVFEGCKIDVVGRCQQQTFRP